MYAAGVDICSEANVLRDFSARANEQSSSKALQLPGHFSLVLKCYSLRINLALSCTAVIALFKGDRCNDGSSKTFQLQNRLIHLCLGHSAVRVLSLIQIFAINASGKILSFYSRLQDCAYLPGLTGLFQVGDALSSKRRGYAVHFCLDN